MQRYFQNKKAFVACLIVLALGLGCATRPGRGLAFAEPPTGGDSWDRVRSLDRDTPVITTLRGGERVRGGLVATDEDEITVAGTDAKAVTIAKSDIETVHVEQRGGSGRRGAMIGAAIGAAAGAGVGTGVGKSVDVTYTITVPIFMGVGAATGALAGYLLGGARSRRVLIYEAP